MSSRRSRKGGQMNLDGVDAKEQIFAEVAGLGLLVQRGIGGGENAHIDAPSLRRADALQLAGLKHAQQFGLLAHRNIGNLIEEKRAAVGQFEAPMRSVRASVNAPFTWPKISLSKVPSGSPPALTATSGLAARGEAA
jgi:hypothetical protein